MEIKLSNLFRETCHMCKMKISKGTEYFICKKLSSTQEARLPFHEECWKKYNKSKSVHEIGLGIEFFGELVDDKI
jgi:hypothetical protein